MAIGHQKRSGRALSITRVAIVFLLALLAFVGLATVDGDVRRVSMSADESLRRVRLIKIPVLQATTVETADRSVDIGEEWVEASMKPKARMTHAEASIAG